MVYLLSGSRVPAGRYPIGLLPKSFLRSGPGQRLGNQLRIVFVSLPSLVPQAEHVGNQLVYRPCLIEIPVVGVYGVFHLGARLVCQEVKPVFQMGISLVVRKADAASNPRIYLQIHGIGAVGVVPVDKAALFAKRLADVLCGRPDFVSRFLLWETFA